MIFIPNFTLNQIVEAAQNVISACGTTAIWLFDAPMGAGKTTLIKAICRELGVVGNVQSPTFSIVNEYLTEAGESIFHFDCYRLKNQFEALDIGAEEYLDSGSLCLIEWPEKMEALLPIGCAKITIEVLADEKRQIRINWV